MYSCLYVHLLRHMFFKNLCKLFDLVYNSLQKLLYYEHKFLYLYYLVLAEIGGVPLLLVIGNCSH